MISKHEIDNPIPSTDSSVIADEVAELASRLLRVGEGVTGSYGVLTPDGGRTVDESGPVVLDYEFEVAVTIPQSISVHKDGADARLYNPSLRIKNRNVYVCWEVEQR